MSKPIVLLNISIYLLIFSLFYLYIYDKGMLTLSMVFPDLSIFFKFGLRLLYAFQASIKYLVFIFIWFCFS